MSVIIVNVGAANFNSVIFSLARLGIQAEVSCDPCVIKSASHVILPGVNAANTAMQYLEQNSLVAILRALTQPVLGLSLIHI